MYEQVRELASDARAAGLVVVVWAYPRGSGLPSKDVETAVDIVCYAVHIAAQLGAHIIKCKPSKAVIGLPDHVKKNTYEGVPIDTLADRTKIVVKSAFNGHRIVINSGGEVLEEVTQLAAGGSFGSIVGRNAFQRAKDESIILLHQIQDIYTK
jgi:class I fructose-bisphosphate aldolase